MNPSSLFSKLVLIGLFCTQSSEAAQALPMEKLAAFTFGLASKWTSQEAGKLMAAPLFPASTNSTATPPLAVTTAQITLSYDIAVVLWSMAHDAFKAGMTAFDNSPRSQALTNFHSSGKDTVCMIELLQDSEKLYQKWMQPTNSTTGVVATLPSHYLAPIVAGAAGFAIAYSAFALGFVAAEHAKRRWYAGFTYTKDMIDTLIIYTIGLVLAVPVQEWFLRLLSWSELGKKCTTCSEAATVGSDLAYILSGVIPGYGKLSAQTGNGNRQKNQ